MARSRQQQTVTSGQPAATAANETVGFSHGVMMVNGILQLMVRFINRLSSNGSTRYTAHEWAHPTDDSRRFSCNCPGWANRRTCKHTKELETYPDLGGLADMGEGEIAVMRATSGITATATTVEHKIHDGRTLRGFRF
jgi:hypothetical protein